MSKFTVKVELQGYKVELGSVKFSVEGTKEDAPRIAQEIERQVSGLIRPPALMTPTALGSGSGNSHSPVIDGELRTDNDPKKRKNKRSIGSGTKVAADEINVSIDPAKHGSPSQSWTTAQKAIWFLYVAAQTTNTKQLTASSLANNFNKHFRSAGAINSGNVGKYLEKERLKGTDATVGADANSGAAKYFLTQAGESLVQRLIKGETAAAAA